MRRKRSPEGSGPRSASSESSQQTPRSASASDRIPVLHRFFRPLDALFQRHVTVIVSQCSESCESCLARSFWMRGEGAHALALGSRARIEVEASRIADYKSAAVAMRT